VNFLGIGARRNTGPMKGAFEDDSVVPPLKALRDGNVQTKDKGCRCKGNSGDPRVPFFWGKPFGQIPKPHLEERRKKGKKQE
jgi:hypothetical protein